MLSEADVTFAAIHGHTRKAPQQGGAVRHRTTPHHGLVFDRRNQLMNDSVGDRAQCS